MSRSANAPPQSRDDVLRALDGVRASLQQALQAEREARTL
jgi:hypothetical protein